MGILDSTQLSIFQLYKKDYIIYITLVQLILYNTTFYKLLCLIHLSMVQLYTGTF